jgi:lia operon protein LiaG
MHQMKAKLYFLVLFAFVASINFTRAQEHRITVQNPQETTLTLSDFYDELPIEGYSGNEIIITSTSSRFKDLPERAKGLKPIYAAGTDNTGIGLNVEKNGNDIRVTSLSPITNHEGSYKIKVPENMSLRIKSDCAHNNSVDIQNMKNELEVNVCQSIKLRNVAGPLELSNISGDIDVVFGTISTKPISIAAISGEIDITLPSKTPANLEMTTVSGNMFSDFDFNADKSDMRRVGGGTINAKLNGGGTDLKITNISGNIYLRKG